MTYDEHGRPFDFNTVLTNWDALQNDEGIDQITLSNEAVARITSVLDLDNCYTEDRLRGIRNAVVKLFGAEESRALHIDPKTGNTVEGYTCTKEDYDNLSKCMKLMSAITAVIDNVLWKRGYAV